MNRGEEAAGTFDAERELVLLCARTRLEGAPLARFHELAGREVRWEIVADLARRHHTFTLLYHHLSNFGFDRLPRAVGDELRSAYFLIAARTLQSTEEALNVLSALEDAGAPGVAWKGPVLSHRVYPSPELRIFNDLDILIRREDFGKARRVLEDRGYVRVLGADDRADDRSDRHGRDVVMARPDAAMQLDLHCGTIRRYFWRAMDSDALWPRHEFVSINGRSIRVLRPEPMVLALAVHGAKHGPYPWPALKWVVDMEALLRALRTEQWTSILDEAGRLGCRRMLLLGVVLARDLLDAPVSPLLNSALENESGIVDLVPGIRDRLLFPDDATITFAERLRFDLAVRERLRDRFVYRATRLLTPGRRDPVPTTLLLRVPLRLARLSRKYLMNPGRGREFVLGRKRQRGAADQD